MKKNYVYFFLLFFLIGCSPKKEEIVFNKNVCEYCSMLITDKKFGSELVTKKGKIYKFDSIECLAAFSNQNKDLNIHSLWLIDFENPGNLINQTESVIFRDEKINSPMGLSFYAVKKNEKNDSKAISWDDTKKIVSIEW